MFDRHQAEITVMQFRGHSLLVHQSMSVSWAFTLSHFVSQICLRDFFRLLAIGMCHFLPVHHFGMACLASKSINSLTKDLEVFEFLIRQVVHEDVWYFPEDEKEPIFISSHEGQEEKLNCKAFEQTQASPLTKHALVFLRKILARIRCSTHRTTIGLLCPHIMY